MQFQIFQLQSTCYLISYLGRQLEQRPKYRQETNMKNKFMISLSTFTATPNNHPNSIQGPDKQTLVFYQVCVRVQVYNIYECDNLHKEIKQYKKNKLRVEPSALIIHKQKVANRGKTRIFKKVQKINYMKQRCQKLQLLQKYFQEVIFDIDMLVWRRDGKVFWKLGVFGHSAFKRIEVSLEGIVETFYLLEFVMADCSSWGICIRCEIIIYQNSLLKIVDSNIYMELLLSFSNPSFLIAFFSQRWEPYEQ